VDGGLTAHQSLQVVLAAHVARVPMGGDDEAHGRAGQLLGDLLHRRAGIDDHGFLGRGVGDYVAVDVAVQLDLDDAELCH